MNSNIGIFSFFSGAGFLDLGFEMSGSYEILFVNEFSKAFMDVYRSSHKSLGIDAPIYGEHIQDIGTFLQTKASKKLQEQISLAKKTHPLIGFIGGPPCPDFSVGGKNRGKEGENGKLSATYIELICRLKPDFFLFENVKGLYRTAKHREFFEAMKMKLISAGYYLTEKLINSIEFGVPQDRERIILLGYRRNVLCDYGFKVNGSPIIRNFNWNSFTDYDVNEVFAYPWPAQDEFIQDLYRPLKKDVPVELTVQHWFEINDVENHANSVHFFKPRAGLEKFLKIKEGDDLKKSFKRLHRWRYSPTAAYGNNEVHLHPYKPRRITVAEALAIQSLPKEFVIPDTITLSDMFKTIGNGVPFLAAKGLANTIIEFLYHNPIKSIELNHIKF